MGLERAHRTLTITRKGGKVVTIPLAREPPRDRPRCRGNTATGRSSSPPRAADSTGTAPGESSAGARRAGIAKNVGPHTLRHAFITAALDLGVPLRDVQEAASHADPRTTMRHDRARASLDRHGT